MPPPSPRFCKELRWETVRMRIRSMRYDNPSGKLPNCPRLHGYTAKNTPCHSPLSLFHVFFSVAPAAEGSLQFEHPSSQQQLLIWKNRPQCVMVLKKLGPELLSDFLDVIEHIGEEEHLRVLVEPHEYEYLQELGFSPPWLDTWTQADAPHLASYVDFVVCLGGDGLVLHGTHLFGHAMPPVISFRLGSLGFLTCHDFSRFREHLNHVINGYQELETCRVTSSLDDSPLRGVHITLRMRLLCSVYRDGKPVTDAVHEVVNEVVLSRGNTPYLSKIDVYERDVLITKVQADGVMLATPTGSTAYSVSAGGSMVHPNVPAILMTPICPHSLSFRPVILPDYAKLELRIAGNARSSALATFDGKFPFELQPGDALRVELSPHPVPTIDNNDQTIDWFNSIDRCFGWNDRTEQLGMQSGEAVAAAQARKRQKVAAPSTPSAV
jgi:NAD+ kinase